MHRWDTSLFLLQAWQVAIYSCKTTHMHLCALLISYIRAHAIFTQQANFLTHSSIYNLPKLSTSIQHESWPLHPKKHQGPKNSTVTLRYVAKISSNQSMSQITLPTFGWFWWFNVGYRRSICQSHGCTIGNDFGISRKFSAQQTTPPKIEETTEFHLAPQRLGRAPWFCMDQVMISLAPCNKFLKNQQFICLLKINQHTDIWLIVNVMLQYNISPWGMMTHLHLCKKNAPLQPMFPLNYHPAEANPQPSHKNPSQVQAL